MRHGKKDNHLGRTASHRKAMLSNMASSLIIHKRIETTLPKAKELRKYVEPLLTRAKEDSTHNRRIVFSYLNDKESTKELFGTVADKIADRPGGYTRIIKLGNRLGDAAEVALVELVDFNDALLLANADKPAKTRRSRRGGKKADDSQAAAAPAKAEAVVAEGDDLKKIEGIGPKIADLLIAGGITSFAELAAATPEAIKEILDAAGSQYNVHNPTTWPQQAQLAADGKWDELKTLQDELLGGRESAE
ncbi:50S ribosomal protein L17 [Dyadobacter luteus]|jgi:large subunit ribosomal protein L17|uniref:Large ribosomal subunit protein bL17 n=1 Tax=Dyadobacter luteus TaxID=2259619 RepID=A0A3D8YCQ4_9BACT|nr:50S ribosomal protein L17 [Dyadobacter luteus]REA62162.1 50S ribosomal protein L17 [Dyadobacter luteus]